MTKIKTTAKKVLFKILSYLGIPAFFSFLGCNLFNQPGSYVCEYGMPTNYFNFDGVVLGDIDGDGIEEKIPDIQITVKDSEISEKTNQDGQFSFRIIDNDYTNQFVYEVTFSDVDGEENGSFEDKSVTVTFNKNEGKKQGNWITNYNTNQEIKLTPKK